MYKEITIKGLRGITYLKIEDFKQVNLFVGRNNCGKTTILEALFLLIGAANAELPSRINVFRDLTTHDENSWRVLFNNMDVNSFISLSGELKNPQETRRLVIKPSIRPKSTAEIGEIPINKQIDVGGYSGISSIIDGLILEYSFTKDKKKSKKVIARVPARGPTMETIVTPDYKETRKGVFLNQKTMRTMGEQFNNIQIKKRTERIVKVLHQIESSVLDLKLGPNNIIYCDIGLDRLIPVNIMGDGMYRLLSIVLAISDMQDGIVFIDGMEKGFSYTVQELFWNTLFELAKEFNVQIFATTHSAECIKAFSSSYAKMNRNTDDMRLYRIEKKGDVYRAIRYDHTTLEASLESGWEVR